MFVFTLIVRGHDHFNRYHCCQGEEDQQDEDPPVQLLVVSIPELVGLRAVNQFIDIYCSVLTLVTRTILKTVMVTLVARKR